MPKDNPPLSRSMMRKLPDACLCLTKARDATMKNASCIECPRLMDAGRS